MSSMFDEQEGYVKGRGRKASLMLIALTFYSAQGQKEREKKGNAHWYYF